MLESAHTRRGIFTSGQPLRHCGSRWLDARVLHSGLLGPFNPASSPNGHRRKRWSDRGVARKRRRDRMMVFGVTSCRVLAARQDWLRRGCNGSQRSRNLLRQGKATRLQKAGSKRAGPKKRTPKRCGGSESTFSVTTKGALKSARIGCSGVCPCVGSAVAEVVGRSPDPEKRRPVIRVNIARGSVGGDGGLARGTSGKAKACSGAAGKRATRAGSSRKHT